MSTSNLFIFLHIWCEVIGIIYMGGPRWMSIINIAGLR
jgi:hypothetical protein